MDLTLHQLEIFREVARARSFTKAASTLLVSQPVISRTIGEVERKLAVALFERTTRSVELTAAGAEFLTVAEDVLDAYRLGVDRFAAYRAGDRGQVTVAALPSIAAGLLPKVVADYHAAHPGVRIRLADGTSREVLDLLRTGAADLAITEDGPASAGLSVRPLFDDPVVAVLPEGHHLAAAPAVTWELLAAEPFIAFSEDSTVRRLTDLGFAHANVAPEHVVQTRAVATAGGMIAAGLGVSAMPRSVLPLLSFGRFVDRPVTGPVVTRKVAVHLRPADRPPVSVRRFLDHLLAD
jgi:DNA-binding transcriptional LysR family regulator